MTTEEKLKIAVEALGWYADENHWDSEDEYSTSETVLQFDDHFESGYMRAQDTIAKITNTKPNYQHEGTHHEIQVRMALESNS